MSGTDDLGTALERAKAKPEAKSVLDTIKGLEPELQRSLQSEQAAAILTRHYLTAIRFNPLLLQCTADSLVAALLLSAQCRLEPGPLGHVYLVPFKDSKRNVHQIVWMLGYAGIVELARRGGAQAISASVVYDADECERPWQNERGWHWRLVPAPPESQGVRVGVLVSWKEERERVALWCPPGRVAAGIAASRNPKAHELLEEDWYWRKTGIRFARPWLPLTTGSEFGLAAAADQAAVREFDVVDGTAVPVLEEASYGA
jgi:hypothetical protein